MDTEKLYRVASDILEEVTAEGIAGHLSNLLSYISQNTPESFESANSTKQTLNNIYERSDSNYYTPTYLEIVDLLGAKDFIGFSGQAALNAILDGSSLDLAPKLKAYVTEFELLVPKLKKLTESFEEFNIKPYGFSEYEIGYVIPAELNDLSDVSKRLTHYYKFISVISTIAGEEDNTVRLSRVSNGSLEFFVLSGISAAKLVDIVLQRVIELYQEVQKIKKISADIENVKANTLKTKTDALSNLVAMEKEYSETFVDQTVEEVMKEYSNGDDQKAELGVQLGVTIKLLLKDIQSGIKVEVSPPDVTEGQNENEVASKVLESITATNIGLIDLYSLPKEDLKLPSGLKVSAAEEKKLDVNIKPKHKAAPKKPKSATTKKPKTKKE